MSLPLHRLPSLDLVRGFVAVGRRMSITLAAQDLCITQSAVSRQIHGLEQALGVQLLSRGYRSLSFTAEGEKLFRVADEAIRQLQEVSADLKRVSKRRIVTITSTVGVTGLWIIPRLTEFQREHPDIEIRFSAETRPVDLKLEKMDLAIRYASRESMPENSEFLFPEVVTPVAHPALGVTQLHDIAELEKHVLLEFDGPYRPWLKWREWLSAMGWDGAQPRGVLRFNQYDQLVQATLAGQGIALGRSPLVASLIAEGRLIALQAPRPGPQTVYGYWLLQAEPQARPEVEAVVQWIRQSAAQDLVVMKTLGLQAA